MPNHGYALHNLDPARDGALGKVHRDLAAHEGRWEFVSSQMSGDEPYEWDYHRGLEAGNYLPTLVRNTHMSKLIVGKAMNGTLVDLGCGPNIYLARMLYSNRRHVSKYIAVDYRMPNPNWKEPHFPLVRLQGDVTTWGIYDKVLAELDGHAPNIVCTFEVIEHMAKEKGQAFIENIAKLCGPHTVVFASTPCHEDGKMPSEHIYEWHHDELKQEFEQHFSIIGNYGTFASQKDIKPVLTAAEREVWNSLEDYYDASYLSTIFAPNHPAESRNSLWVMQKK